MNRSNSLVCTASCFLTKVNSRSEQRLLNRSPQTLNLHEHCVDKRLLIKYEAQF